MSEASCGVIESEKKLERNGNRNEVVKAAEQPKALSSKSSLSDFSCQEYKNSPLVYRQICVKAFANIRAKRLNVFRTTRRTRPADNWLVRNSARAYEGKRSGVNENKTETVLTRIFYKRFPAVRVFISISLCSRFLLLLER